MPVAPSSAAESVRFREVQSSRGAWIGPLLVVAIGLVPSAWRLVERFPGGVDGVVVFWAVLAWLLLRWKMVTEVRDGVLQVRFVPAQRRSIPLSSIKAVDVATYYPAIDGGWGVRRGQAVRIWVEEGDFLLLGTARPDELRRALLAGNSSGN